MKKKFLLFIKEKKDVFLFVFVLLLVFTSVLIISKVVSNPNEGYFELNPGDDPIINPDPDDPDPISKEKFIYPLEGEYEIVVDFFDSKNASTIEKSIILISDTEYRRSNGLIFTKDNNEAFDVLAVFSGVVEEIEGSKVIIKYDDNLKVVYEYLDHNLSEGQVVKQKDVLGKSMVYAPYGYCILIEVIKDNKYLNPVNLLDTIIEEL